MAEEPTRLVQINILYINWYILYILVYTSVYKKNKYTGYSNTKKTQVPVFSQDVEETLDGINNEPVKRVRTFNYLRSSTEEDRTNSVCIISGSIQCI